MKNKLALVIFIFSILFSYSQSKDVEIVSMQTDIGYILSAVNNSNVRQEVTLTVVPTNLKGYKNPIKKLVLAKTKVEMLKLFFIKNKRGGLSSRYTYKPSMTQEEKNAQDKKLDEKVTNEIGDIGKGIIVFSKDGCPRCHYTTSFLLDNNIDFRLINTSKNEEQNKVMWELLKKDNPNIQRLSMPVVIIDGQVSFNIDDLKVFVAKLK